MTVRVIWVLSLLSRTGGTYIRPIAPEGLLE